MAIPSWPTNLHYEVARTGFQLIPHEPLAGTDMDSGAKRQRERFTTSPARVQVQWDFIGNEFSEFQSFYKFTLKTGARWFNIPIYLNNREDTYLARFVPEPYTVTHGGYQRWIVSATLILNELFYTDEGTTYWRTQYTDAFTQSFTASINNIVNQQLPAATEKV